MIFVVDAVAAGQMLRAGRLACPDCDGRLRVWTPARTRVVAALGGERVSLTPDRGRCSGCGITHVVLPAWYVPRRGYTIEVIGQVLLAGATQTPTRAIADRLALPTTTVATWLRQARDAAVSMLRHACTLAVSTVGDGRSPARWLGTALAQALDALGDAARAVARAAVPVMKAVAGPGQSGIDYLGLLATEHHRLLLRRLHQADPAGALATASPWQVVNLMTARRGLFTTSLM